VLTGRSCCSERQILLLSREYPLSLQAFLTHDVHGMQERLAQALSVLKGIKRVLRLSIEVPVL